MRRSPWPVPAMAARLAWAAVVAVFFLMTLGNVVSATGSGLACPDWPLCHGSVIPPLRLDVLIEYSHRLAALAATALIVATTVAALRGIRAPGLRRLAWLVPTLLAVQIALGGWVSSNYAVLACRGFPQCNGQWWPPTNFAEGFTLLRELGRSGSAGYVSFEALVAIQMAHRVFAVVVLGAALLLAARLWREGSEASRRAAAWLVGVLVLQLLSGLSNVLLDWPLLSALAHTTGAAGLVALLVALACRAGPRAAVVRVAVDRALAQRHA